jgi:hypothetical protein
MFSAACFMMQRSDFRGIVLRMGGYGVGLDKEVAQ